MGARLHRCRCNTQELKLAMQVKKIYYRIASKDFSLGALHGRMGKRKLSKTISIEFPFTLLSLLGVCTSLVRTHEKVFLLKP